ncbi:hypothetical protein AWU68_1344 [Corynebacterium simulans]|uniref:ImmA/IrrE family metallo-endopeptidase n=1 Tax=Corynebacterium TaxID=1716 RepID=UPI000781DE20|nr:MULTISPECIES: hypothetical protein [Corynebacterium]AMO91625.1 hypothetical protein AWU68_1344 [Corynebacterium simulans]OFR40944.1 hypothetical protein HMPREF2888_04085 [Corynebacterium sp. HMSC077D03]
MSFIEDRLHALLDEQGVELVETGRLDARYSACAIAHELGHAAHGDSCSSPRAERLADEWAAQRLVDGDRIEKIAADCDGAPSAIAAELGATPHLLEVWMRLLEAGRVMTMSCAIY